MNNSVLGLIFSNMYDDMVSELTANRCMGSIPVGGRYRLIDFPLSGFANAGVEDVGVITKSNYQSLMDHLGTGREWDLTRKRGGLAILPPFGQSVISGTGMYRNRVEALMGVMGYIKANNADYILGSDCDYMANIDYADFMDSHEKSGADISLMYKKMSLDGDGARDVSTFMLDGEGYVRDMLIYPQLTGEHNVYLNTIFISRELLERVVSECHSRNLSSFDKDVLQAGVGRYKIHAYEFKGYAGRFDSMKGYYATNMSLLNKDVRASLFPQYRPVYTKVRDEAPVRYGLDSSVRNVMLGDGCVIEGEVENSIIFRGVTIAKGAKVRNSVIMQGTKIGEGANLDCIITDKDVVVSGGRSIMGFSTYPVYIAKGSVV
jgi:glucose-1-phosphate adenylyltransferase